MELDGARETSMDLDGATQTAIDLDGAAQTLMDLVEANERERSVKFPIDVFSRSIEV